MNKIEFEGGGRSMRWYEWLLGLALVALAAGARAESIYKCIAADGVVTYQDRACAYDAQERVIRFTPMPAAVPAAHGAVEHHSREEAPRAPHPTQPASVRRQSVFGESAYECHASDGRVFYRLSACPRTLAAADGERKSGARGRGGSRSGSAIAVTSRRIAREEACREIHRAGAIGRNGHEFDEIGSTYERNLGHDPCHPS